jgi:biopolymer transport protein ExbB
MLQSITVYLNELYLGLPEAWQAYLVSAWELFLGGGWAMYPLAVTAFICYAKCGEMFFTFFLKFYRRDRYFGGRKVISTLGAEAGASDRVFAAAQRYLKFHKVKLRDDSQYEEVNAAFDELRAEELPPLDRDLKFINVTVAAAPLWGLLGTVTGMLTTFDGLSKGGGGDKTMNVVAGGISEALITTETGLMVALPGYFLHYMLTSNRSKFEGFIEHLQNACGQRVLHPDNRTQPQSNPS